MQLRYDAFGRLERQWGDGVNDQPILWDRGHVYAILCCGLTSTYVQYSYYPGTDRLHTTWVGNHHYMAHQDGVGNVSALTENSTVKRTYVYDEWGQLKGGSDPGNLANRDRARFKGALWMGDAGVELCYMRNRWYEPRTGRFLSEDPIGLAGGINLHVFAAQDPVNLADPSGLHSCEKAGGDHTEEHPFGHHDENGRWITDSVVIEVHAGCAEDGAEATAFASQVAATYMYHFALGYQVYLRDIAGAFTFLQIGVSGDIYTTGGGASYSKGWFVDERGFGHYNRVGIGIGWLYNVGWRPVWESRMASPSKRPEASAHGAWESAATRGEAHSR